MAAGDGDASVPSPERLRREKARLDEPAVGPAEFQIDAALQRKLAAEEQVGPFSGMAIEVVVAVVL